MGRKNVMLRLKRKVGNTYYRLYRKIKMPKLNKKADKFLPYYMDDLSKKTLALRKKYNACVGTQRQNYTMFLDFVIDNSLTMKLDDEKHIKRLVIIYDTKNSNIYEYTLKLLKYSRFEKDNSFREVSYRNIDGMILEDDDIVLPLLRNGNLMKEIIKKFDGKIYIPPYERIVAQVENQYFDVFSPIKDEIIVDAGACNGQTDLDFLEWGGDSVKKIYAFESDPSNCDDCENFIRKYCDGRVQLVRKGAWNKTTKLYISDGNGTHGSKVGENGDTAIEVAAIDDIVENDKVTFIKMDIEGAELKALEGAKRTIITNHPRLAICVYHRLEDIWEIPEYILSLVPEYRFKLRHYTTTDWETVLYAFVP